jgi:hypothetical protein
MRPSRGLNWSEEEIAFLVANAEILPIERIARRMDRSVDAITRKAHYLGISLSLTLDNWSAKSLGRLLGVHGNTVNTWIANGELKATRSRKTKKSSHRISRKDFKEFYIKYKDVKLSLSQVNPDILEWIMD